MISAVRESLAALRSRLWPVNAAPRAPGDLTARKNMEQLIQLRWMAVFGQVATIIYVQVVFHINLALAQMAAILAALVTLNIVSLVRLKRSSNIGGGELFAALAFDLLALTAQLYLSGGAGNPFASLFLLQVTLGAVLLEVWATWALVGIAVACFFGLTLWFRPIAIPVRFGGLLLDMQLEGMLIAFVLTAALLAIFVTQVTANLRERDARLSDLRQQAAEEDYIVRMGLLASGAAHELGTPLATLDVILGDWRRMPKLAGDKELAQEIEDMRAEVRRCKTIVTGVLMSAGEARGEQPVVTTLKTFLGDVIEDWRSTRSAVAMVYHDTLSEDVTIVSDSALKQVIHNVLDNAQEAEPVGVSVRAERREDELFLSVSDAGPGFQPQVLANVGKPYNSSKARLGGGLGLFLVVNVVRKLGGRVTAENRPGGGARVRVILPLSALAIESPHAH
jgi:two-component system sensor histidine kinase RegB